MKIIFTKDSPGNGKKGEIKEVSEGYAKNFLIAKGFAQIATPQIIAKVEKEKKEARAKTDRETERLNNLKKDLEKRLFVLKVKVGEQGQVFGGVHEKDVAKSISEKLNVAIEKNQVQITSAIKSLGEHKVIVNLGGSVKALVKIKVESL